MEDRGPKLVEVLLDDATWDAASPERRSEWRAVLDDLISEHRFSIPVTNGSNPAGGAITGQQGTEHQGADHRPPGSDGHRATRMFVTADPERIRFDAQTLEGREVAVAEISISAMSETLTEYFKICFDMGRLGEGDNSSKLEALDIAKRLVHDEAAEAVQRLLRPLAPDHPTARRLFTLIVAIHFDTTRLVRPHHLDATLSRLRE